MFGASSLALGLARKTTSAGRYTNYQSKGGNTQLSTADKKFGTASVAFDGDGDYLTANNQYGADGSYATHDNFIFTGEFTVEMWIYGRHANSNTGNKVIATNVQDETDTITNHHFEIRWDYYDSSNGQIYWRIGNTSFQGGTTVAVDTWHHVALVRESDNSVSLYVNGTLSGSSSTLSYQIGNNTYSINKINFGLYPSTGAYDFYQNIDEIRVSTSARYTGNFTPSTSEFTNDEDTVLLLHCNGTNGATTFTDDNS